MSGLLSASDIWLRRGDRELFGGLSLSIQSGSLIWLRAPNGSGKTTLLRILAGLLEPEQGSLLWKAHDFALRYETDRAPISLLDEKLGLARDLDVSQNLAYFAALANRSIAQQRQTIAELQLESLLMRPVAQLSTGQKKRVALARLLMENAELWLLDEPANGLDTANRALLCRQVEAHIQAGGACLYASHDALPFEQTVEALDLEDLCGA